MSKKSKISLLKNISENGLINRNPSDILRDCGIKPTKENVKDIVMGQYSVNALTTSMERSTEQLMSTIYGGKVDIYAQFGYKEKLELKDYDAKYKRNAYAQPVVEFYAKMCWRTHPFILDGENIDVTKFQQDIKDLNSKVGLWDAFRDADILSGVGRYGVLVIGYNDVKNINDWKKPVTQNASLKISWFQSHEESRARITKYESDFSSPRYGMPAEYSVQLHSAGGDQVVSIHYSRCVHVCTEGIGNKLYGDPRMESVFNNLDNTERIHGASGEGYRRAAHPGIAGDVSDKIDTKGFDTNEVKKQMNNYVNKYSRFLLVDGVSFKTLAPNVRQPVDFLKAEYTAISVAKRIPQRALLGTEEGRLAGDQDGSMVTDVATERRHNTLTPIVRDFIQNLIEYKLISKPASGDFQVDWEALFQKGAKEAAEVGEITTRGLVAYADSMSASDFIPEDFYLSQILGFSQEQITQLNVNKKKIQSVDDGIGDEETELVPINEEVKDEPPKQ